MGSEASLWKTLRDGVKRAPAWHVHLVRVENDVEVGTPDVNYCAVPIRLHPTSAISGSLMEGLGEGVEGWIELKHRHHWPARERTVVRLDHYTQEQRDWLLRRTISGGRAWLLLQVEREYLLFDGVAAQQVGRLTRKGLGELARCTWQGRLNYAELIECLTKP